MLPLRARAWSHSAAWALGCVGSCGLLWWRASENNAFQFEDQGQDHLLCLLLAVLTAAVLFHKRAYKAFQQAYLAQGPGRHGDRLAQAWLLLLSMLRAGWLLASVLLVLLLLLKGSNTNSGWQ